MNRNIYRLLIILMTVVFMSCSNSTMPTKDLTITEIEVAGIGIPVRGVSPVTTSIDHAQYTGIINWTPSATIFAPATVYTAVITLVAKQGWTFDGIAKNSLIVSGATVSNEINSGTVIAVFPETDRPMNFNTLPLTLSNVLRTNNIFKTTSSIGWNGSVYSTKKVSTPLSIKFKLNGYSAVGLSKKPDLSNSLSSIDYCIIFSGGFFSREAGIDNNQFETSYINGAVIELKYDNHSIEYYQNKILLRKIDIEENELYFDTSIGDSIGNIEIISYEEL